MNQDDFTSGIYRHYNNGKLYFASEIRENHTSGELFVSYDALYPLYPARQIGYTQPMHEFFGKVQKEGERPTARFTLVQEFPRETMRMFLPGARVHELNVPSPHVVDKFIEEDGVVLIALKRLTDDAWRTFLLDTYIRIFESAE